MNLAQMKTVEQLEHQAAFQAITLAAQFIKEHRKQLEALIDSEQYMHSVGGMLDPTLYLSMLYSKNFALQMRLANAALAFIKEFEAVEVIVSPKEPKP